MKSHYLLIVLPDGKQAVRREYVGLEREDETITEATERWIQSHPEMVKRVRNRERKANELRTSILERRICRPSSWHREQAEREGRPYPSPPLGTRRSATRRRAA